MSTRDAPKAAPGDADRRRTPRSVPESARALGLTTYARPSLATARAAETSRGAMTCAAFAGAAATSTSPMAQPHARVGFTHGEHIARRAGCARASAAAVRVRVRGGSRPGHRGEGSQRRFAARAVVLDRARAGARTARPSRHLRSAGVERRSYRVQTGEDRRSTRPSRRQGRKMLRNARRAENLRRHTDNGARPGRRRSFSLGEQFAAQRRKRPRRPDTAPQSIIDGARHAA